MQVLKTRRRTVEKAVVDGDAVGLAVAVVTTVGNGGKSTDARSVGKHEHTDVNESDSLKAVAGEGYEARAVGGSDPASYVVVHR